MCGYSHWQISSTSCHAIWTTEIYADLVYKDQNEDITTNQIVQESIYVINWGSSFLYFMPFCLLLCCRLRGTTLGANNRMDLLSLSTSKVNSDGITEPGEDILGPVELQESVISRISHQRGLAPFAFVPFEEVCTEPNVWSIKSYRVLS